MKEVASAERRSDVGTGRHLTGTVFSGQLPAWKAGAQFQRKLWEAVASSKPQAVLHKDLLESLLKHKFLGPLLRHPELVGVRWGST